MNHTGNVKYELTNPMTPRVTVPLRSVKQQQQRLRMAISEKKVQEIVLLYYTPRNCCIVLQKW